MRSIFVRIYSIESISGYGTVYAFRTGMSSAAYRQSGHLPSIVVPCAIPAAVRHEIGGCRHMKSKHVNLGNKEVAELTYKVRWAEVIPTFAGQMSESHPHLHKLAHSEGSHVNRR